MNRYLLVVICIMCMGVAFPALLFAGQYNQPTKHYARIGDAPSKVRFAKAIEDLPLMPGLDLDEGEDVLFVFGSSRIAQTSAKGFVDIDSVYYFYQDTLPQLGWKQISPRLYARDKELLHLEASSANADGKTYVRFEVKPE